MKNVLRSAGLAALIPVLLVTLCAWSAPRAGAKEAAHPSVALAGTVSSEAEGLMEGVVVKAKRAGGTITLSVVSDDHGHYVFPADRLKPGEYSLTVRAAGFDVPKTTVTVGSDPATADLKLSKVGTFVMAQQLMPAEWLLSAPPSNDKYISVAITDCESCHNTDVVFKSTYDADGWMTTLL